MSRRRLPILAALAVTVLTAAGGLACAGPAGAQSVFPAVAVDGPDPSIVALGNVSMARDGSGAVTYLKSVGGVAHAFASLETGGAWSPPQQLDAGLPGPASQPVVAAAANGRTAAVFIDAGALFAAVRPAGASAFGAPQQIAPAASNPALGISTDGTAYVAFTAPAGGVSDVYVAFMDRSTNAFAAPLGQPLNLSPADNAGYSATTRSQIAVATDGTALVAWGENESGTTHVIARRVSEGGLSNAPQDLNLTSLNGVPGGSADSPSVTVEDVADYAWVAFRETFNDNGAQISRTIARHELGSAFDPTLAPGATTGTSKGPTVIDPLAFPTADGADDPQVEMEGAGSGIATIETTVSREVFADPLQNPAFGTPERVDAIANTIAPEPVAAIGGIDDLGAVAWLQSTGPSDPPAVHARYYDGSGFSPEAVVSQPLFGAVQTGAGALSGAADRYGDTLLAFLQGAPASTRVVVGGIANPPRGFGLTSSLYTREAQARIGWHPASDPLGVTYTVEIDGKVVLTTPSDTVRLTAPLAAGPHRLVVRAVNGFGLSSTPGPVTLVVTTHAPQVTLAVRGKRAAASKLSFKLERQPQPTTAPLASAKVSFGDGSSGSGLSLTHAYSRAGTFTVTAVIADRAGYHRTVRKRITIA